MDSDDGDCYPNTELYIYLIYKAYSRIMLNLRGRAFLCLKKVRMWYLKDR